jgi:hypothetical protein
MTDEQTAVLTAALDLVNGGLDLEECLDCYRVISKYVMENPPQVKYGTYRCELPTHND